MIHVVKFVRVLLGAVFLTAVWPAAANSQDGVPAGPPQLSSLESDGDLASAMDDYASELQGFLNEKKPGEYAVVTGIGTLTSTDRGSAQYVLSLKLAYKEALLQAYINLSKKISRDGTQLATRDSTNFVRTSGDLIEDDLIARCKEEAQKEYARYQRQKERDQKKQDGDANSLANKVIDVFKSDDRVEAEREALERQAAAAPPEPDYIHSCSSPADVFVAESYVAESIADMMSGGRVWASMIHDGQIAVVLVRSGDTAEVASVLKNQKLPAIPLSSASREVKERIKKEMEAYPGIPMGLVGTRMMKLSNGEWALYSFGAAQMGAGGGQDTMSRRKNTATSSDASTEALAELSRFSGMKVNFDKDTVEKTATQSSFTVKVNVTRDTVRLEVESSETLGKVVDEAYNGESALRLVGSQPVFNKVYEDDGIKYRLKAVAWSPSIMANNVNKGVSQDAQAANAVRNGKYIPKGQSAAGDSDNNASESQPAVLSQDW
jgi:hypothetical protein